jgi:4-amino-4-deoxy-L-arabinose transferase-like glycosyltransferase
MRGDRPLLIVILIIAAWTRLTDLDLGWFMMDQARDAAAALKIAEGANFPIVGPVARGLYALGPLYYYLIAIPFVFSKQPAAAVFLIGLLNCVSVYLAYRLGREFFSPTVGLVGAALYAVFPMAIVSSHAMWNPAFVPFFATIVLYALFSFIVAGRPWGLTVTLAALGCLFQIHLSALALVPLFLVVLALFRPPIPRRHAFVGLALVLALFAPYFVFEAARGFQGISDAARFLGKERLLQLKESWVQIAWRALHAPFTIPAQMPPASGGGTTPSVLRFAQHFELAAVVIGLFWLVGSSLRRWRRDGRMPKPYVLLLLWMIIPLIVLTQKKQVLMWYYFDILYPAQFLVIGLLVDGIRHLVARHGAGAGAERAASLSAGLLVALIMSSQVLFLQSLRRDILEHGSLRLPTEISLRFPDPLWFIREKGFLDLMPSRYKRELTAAILDQSPLDRASFYLSVHGSAFEDLIEDRGYFYEVLRRDGMAREETHYALVRAQQWPAGIDGVARETGPFRLVRYRPSVRYAFWRYSSAPRPQWFTTAVEDASWPLVRLPARNLPNLSEYAQTPLESWGHSPVYFRGQLFVNGAVEKLYLVVALRDLPPEDQRHRIGAFYVNGRRLQPVAVRSYLTALTRSTEVVVGVADALHKGPNLVAFEVDGAYPSFDLDVYEVRWKGEARG